MGICYSAEVFDGNYTVDTVSSIRSGAFHLVFNANITKIDIEGGVFQGSSQIYFIEEPGNILSIQGTPDSFEITGMRAPIKCTTSRTPSSRGLTWLEGEVTVGANDPGPFKLGLEPRLS